MVYMIGSDLESEDGSATDDLLEMADAALSENIHLVLQTGGTETWWNDVCTDDESERFVIENGDMTLEDIAYALNLESGAYFCKLFKKRTGQTPGEYRKSRT